MRKKTRIKGLRSSENILGPGVVVKEYGIGLIGPDPRGTAASIILTVAAIVAVAVVFFHVILVPGILFLVALAATFEAIDRPASFAVTDRGLVVLARSEINGRPRKILTVLPESVLTSPTVKRSGGYVHLPDLHVWIRKNDHERLIGAAQNNGAARQWAPPVPAGVGATSGPARNVPPSRLTGPTLGASDPGAGATLQPDSQSDVVYCSWCGKERSVNALAIHYCGSMERPAVFCMRCGTALGEDAAACGSCGTPATQLSR